MFDSIAIFVAGICAGGGLVWVLAQSRTALHLARLAAAKDAERALLEARTARLENELALERAASKEKLALLEEARQRFSDAFQALSAEALRRNNASFLELANVSLERFQESARGDLEQRQTAITELVKPVRESLEKVDAKIQEIEKTRAGAYEGLIAQIRSMTEAQSQLRGETHRLSTALRSPVVRGRWGEMQLRRVVELAGMLSHCDFTEQSSQATETGRQRPDLLIHLPGGKEIVVDAKAPLVAYLEALEAHDEKTRDDKMREHAGHLRAHIDTLGKKAYWEQFPQAPELVLLFLPGENFFSAALESDPALLEYGTERNVILATPTTLISLLKAVFYGWRQQRLAESAEEIASLGRELGKRLADMGCHVDRLGRSLKSAVEHYNRLVATTESRVLVTVRKFHALEPAGPGEEPATLEQIETAPRHLQAPEWAPDRVES